MKRTYRLAGSIVLAAGLSLLSACSILPKPEIVDVYRLPAAQAHMTFGRPVKDFGVLKIEALLHQREQCRLVVQERLSLLNSAAGVERNTHSLGTVLR